MKVKLAAVAATLVAAAGGATIAVTSGSDSRCDVNNYAMQCVVPPSPSPSSLFGVTAPRTQGIDFGWSGVSAATARAGGYRFGASYLSADRSKNWTSAFVNAYHRAGLATVSVWETSATRALSGFAAGQADARSALGESLALGNGSRPIYFAIDFDETAGQAGLVANYFRGIHRVLDNAGPVSFPRPVPVGAYGGYWAVKRLFDARLISYGWQTYAWSGGLWDHRAQLQQYLNGSSFDHDRAVAADYGQVPYAAPRPKPKPKPARVVCFTKNNGRSNARACKPVIALYLRRERALLSTHYALSRTRVDLHDHGCTRPYRRAVCVHDGRSVAVLTQRERWFFTHAASLRKAYS